MKHTLRIHASTETTDQPLPDVALPRLREATDNIEFSVDIEAHIVPERDRMGQPRHERIVVQFEIDESDVEQVAVDELAQTVLHDVPWYVIYHKQDGDSWTEVVRAGDVPAVL